MVATKVLLFLCLSCFCTGEILTNVGIIGGHPINIKQAPFMAQVRMNKEVICGGSIIHESFILTAAHCVKPFIGSDFVLDIQVGTDIRSSFFGGKLYKVKDYVIHPNHSSLTNEFDACLIKLSKPMKFGKRVKAIKLADSSVELPTSTMLNVTGWGASKTEDFSKHLMQASMLTISRETCQLYFWTDITSNMICTSEMEGKSACRRDSGGPLTQGDIQVGVVLGGSDICGLVPSIYTKVSALHSWILSIVGDLP